MGGGRRRHEGPVAEPLRSGEAPGEQADGGRLDIAFAAGDLSGKAQTRIGFQPQRLRRAVSAN